jgi:hypothetical protein
LVSAPALSDHQDLLLAELELLFIQLLGVPLCFVALHRSFARGRAPTGLPLPSGGRLGELLRRWLVLFGR